MYLPIPMYSPTLGNLSHFTKYCLYILLRHGRTLWFLILSTSYSSFSSTIEGGGREGGGGRCESKRSLSRWRRSLEI